MGIFNRNNIPYHGILTKINRWEKGKTDFLDTIVPEERAMYKYDCEHGIVLSKYKIMLGVSTINSGSGINRLENMSGTSLSRWTSGSGEDTETHYDLDIHFTQGRGLRIRLLSQEQIGAKIEAHYFRCLLNMGRGYEYRKYYLTDSFEDYNISSFENDMIRGIQPNTFYQILNAHKGIWASAKEDPYSSIGLASWDMRPYEPGFLIRLQGLLLKSAEEAEKFSKGDDKYLIQLYRPHIMNISYISEAIEWNYGWHFRNDDGFYKNIIYKAFDRMLQCFGIFDLWNEYLRKYNVNCAKLAYIQSAYGRYFSMMWDFENEYILDENTKLEIIRKSRKKRLLGKTIIKPKDWSEIRPGDHDLETRLGSLIQKYCIIAKTCTENHDALQKLEKLEQLFGMQDWFHAFPHRPYVDVYDRLGDKWVQICRIMDQIGMYDDFFKFICQDGADPSKGEELRNAIIHREYIEGRLLSIKNHS